MKSPTATPARRATHTGRLARGGTLSLVGVLAGAALQFLLVVVVTRGLTTASAGAFLEATAVFMILSNVGDLGADDGLLRGIARLRTLQRLDEARPLSLVALGPVVVLGIVAAMATYVLSGDIARAVLSPPQQSAGALYLKVFSGFLPIASATNVALSGTRGFGAMRPYVAISNIVIPILRVTAVGVSILAGAGTMAVGFAWAVPMVAGCVAALVVLNRMTRRLESPAELERRTLRSIARNLWGFSAPRAVASTFGVTITYLDVLLVGAFSNTRDAAIYAATSRLWVGGNFALQAIRTAVAPQFSELIAQHQLDALGRLYQTSTAWGMALSWPVYLLFALFAPVFTRVFGHSYGAGANALVILSVAGLVNGATNPVAVVLLMAGKSFLNLLNTGAALAVNIGLNVVLIPRLGIEGAAIAWTASLSITAVASMVQVRRLTGINLLGPGVWIVGASSLGAFGMAGLLVKATAGASVTGLCAAVLVGAALFAIPLWIARETLELSVLQAMLQKRRTSLPR